MENDNTAATVAKRKLLQQQLADAKANLEETEYDHSISAQEKSLDEQLSQYKEARQREIDELNAYLENETQVLSDTFTYIKDNAIEIGNTLVTTAQEHGVQISDELTRSWQSGENAIAAYGQTLSSATSSFISQLDNVENETYQLQEQANATSENIAQMFANRADVLVSELERSWVSEENLRNTTQALQEAFVNAINTGGRIREINGPMESAAAATDAVADAAENAAGAFDNMASSARAASAAAQSAIEDLNNLENKSSSSGSVHSLYNAPYSQATKYDWGTSYQYYNKKKGGIIYGHAKGLSKAEKDELAWTQELGAEAIVSPTRNSILTPIKAGDAVLDAKATKNLFELAKINPNDLLNGSGANIVAPQVESTNNSVSIGNLVNVEGSISSENLDDVKATIQSELRKTFRNINNGLRK